MVSLLYFKARKSLETFNFKLFDYEKCGFRAFICFVY